MCSILFIYFLKDPLLGKDSGVAKPAERNALRAIFFLHIIVLYWLHTPFCVIKKKYIRLNDQYKFHNSPTCSLKFINY